MAWIVGLLWALGAVLMGDVEGAATRSVLTEADKTVPNWVRLVAVLLWPVVTLGLVLWCVCEWLAHAETAPDA